MTGHEHAPSIIDREITSFRGGQRLTDGGAGVGVGPARSRSMNSPG